MAEEYHVKYKNLTIRKRLNISNILMIAVPVLAAAILILFAALGIFIYNRRTDRIAGMSNEETLNTCEELVEDCTEILLEGGSPEDEAFEEKLSDGRIRMMIRRDGEKIYDYGVTHQSDGNLLNAAFQIADYGYIAVVNRQLYVKTTEIEGASYRFYIFMNKVPRPYSGFALYGIISAAVFILMVILAASILNHFLTEFVFHKINGPIRILSDGVREIRDGNLDYRIGYDVHDEFEQVCADFNEMAERLQASDTEIAKQNESRKQLIAGISHDLRSPLTSISAYADGLMDGIAETPETERKYLQKIKDKSSEMIRMVQRLFMFSKMELGQYPIYPEVLDLKREIADWAAAAAEEYAEKGLEIRTALSASGRVLADPEQLRTVFNNIAENAQKYKNKPQGLLNISLDRTAEGLRIRLADNGPGVPEEALPKLFEVFYRNDPARKNAGNGSGIGLAITANAVNRMNGTIRAENASEGGLVFVIDLPETEDRDEQNTDH